MRCLVLGGGGFIGTHVVRALKERRHTVRVMGRREIARNTEPSAGEVEVLSGDITVAEHLERAMRGIEVLVHLACTTTPGTSMASPEHDVETNLLGSVRVIRQAVASGVKRLVFASSGGAVYGEPRAALISEDHPTDPICAYGIHKLAVEKYLQMYGRVHGLDYVVLRPGNAYGEGQGVTAGFGAVTTFLATTMRDEEMVIWGDGSAARDYVHVADLASAFVKAAEAQPASRIFNIGSGRAWTLLDIARMVHRVTGRQPRLRFEKARGIDVGENCLDASRARRELDWEPRVGLQEGIERTYAWLKKSHEVS